MRDGRHEAEVVDVTHEDLRKSAVRWLTVRRRCSVVLSEMVSAAREIPDAVGWHGGQSYLVECKVSRSDFLRNEDKPCLRAGRGIGTHRYFLCPTEIIRVDDLNGDGYGLLWVGDSGNVRIQKEANPREANYRDEVAMLVSALRRVRTREFLTLVAADDERETPA